MAPASAPLRKVLERLDVRPPRKPLTTNVTGGYYPDTREEILDLLAKHGIRGSFFVPAVVAEAYPELLPAFVERGHEVGLHGFFHEIVAHTSDAEFSAALDASLALFQQQVGLTPKGFRSPAWEMTPHMMAELQARGMYDSSLSGFDNPYTLGLGRLVNLDKKADFIGREALIRILAEGNHRRLVGIEIDSDPISHNEAFWPVLEDQEKIGHVSRCVWSPRAPPGRPCCGWCPGPRWRWRPSRGHCAGRGARREARCRDNAARDRPASRIRR